MPNRDRLSKVLSIRWGFILCQIDNDRSLLRIWGICSYTYWHIMLIWGVHRPVHGMWHHDTTDTRSPVSYNSVEHGLFCTKNPLVRDRWIPEKDSKIHWQDNRRKRWERRRLEYLLNIDGRIDQAVHLRFLEWKKEKDDWKSTWMFRRIKQTGLDTQTISSPNKFIIFVVLISPKILLNCEPANILSARAWTGKNVDSPQLSA